MSAERPEVGECEVGLTVEQLIDVVLEAIAVPSPATLGDVEPYRETLVDRVGHTRVALERLRKDSSDSLANAWTLDYLRARLADHPVTAYKHWGAPALAGRQA